MAAVSTRIGTWGTRIGIAVVRYRIFFFLVVGIRVGVVVVRVGQSSLMRVVALFARSVLVAVGLFLPCLESLPVFHLLGVEYFFELSLAPVCSGIVDGRVGGNGCSYPF